MESPTNTAALTWEAKAHRIIGALSLQAYKEAGNPYPITGARRKHKPYTVPLLAVRLVDCLKMHDRASAEATAKRMFIEYACGLPADSPLLLSE